VDNDVFSDYLIVHKVPFVIGAGFISPQVNCQLVCNTKWAVDTTSSADNLPLLGTGHVVSSNPFQDYVPGSN